MSTLSNRIARLEQITPHASTRLVFTPAIEEQARRELSAWQADMQRQIEIAEANPPKDTR
jgi:hypothetical protein